MKDKYQKLLTSIKAKLSEAESALEKEDFETAKKLQGEAKALREQASVMKAQIESAEELEEDERQAEVKNLKAKNAKLEKDAKSPVTLPFSSDDEETEEDEGSTAKAINTLRYGGVDEATKVALKDLYGTDYFGLRERQRDAFVKYIRVGENRLKADEFTLLRNKIVLSPEVIASEIKAGRSMAEIKITLEEGSLDLGGALVPEDYRAEIIKRLMGLTVVRGRARVVTTVRDAIEWPRLDGGNTQYTSAVRVTWVDETPASATTAETNPTFGMIRIPIHTVMARTNLSRNLVEDSAFNLLDVMADLFAEAMATDEDTQFLTGIGTGRPYGVLGDRSGAEAIPVAGVTDVNSGNATTITADGIVDLVYSLPAQYRGNGVLVAGRTTIRDIRKLKDGNGDYLWERGIARGEPQTVLGYPILEDEGMPAIAANAYPILFGDWKGYVIADRVGMSIERVEDTTTKGTNVVALFARRRLGGQVVMPWNFAAQQISA